MRKNPVLTLALGAIMLSSVVAATPANARATDTAPWPGPPPLRVMTYNIQHGAGLDGVLNVDRTAAAIAAVHPDVVGLEEVDDHWSSRSADLDETSLLADKLHMCAFFAQIYDLPPQTTGAPDREYGLAILSRYPILDSQNHQITRLSTTVPNPSPAAAPGFP